MKYFVPTALLPTVVLPVALHVLSSLGFLSSFCKAKEVLANGPDLFEGGVYTVAWLSLDRWD